MGEDVDRTPNVSRGHVTVEREHLEQLQRGASVGAVASSVAHEFNNILTAILNHAKLGERSNDPAIKQRSFEKILAAARRAAKVTTGVLALSRNRTARKEAVDLVGLVEEVLAVLEKDLAKHQVRLERRFDGSPRAEIVPPQIEQVIMNLIINGRQAMPNGGDLVVSVHANEQSRMAEISVRDSGVGIAPDKLNRIFDPFFSTKDGPDQEGQGGSGLGLSICREIIERHNGRIRVESLLRRGTNFTVKLPLVDANRNPHAA